MPRLPRKWLRGDALPFLFVPRVSCTECRRMTEVQFFLCYSSYAILFKVMSVVSIGCDSPAIEFATVKVTVKSSQAWNSDEHIGCD